MCKYTERTAAWLFKGLFIELHLFLYTKIILKRLERLLYALAACWSGCSFTELCLRSLNLKLYTDLNKLVSEIFEIFKLYWSSENLQFPNHPIRQIAGLDSLENFWEFTFPE